MMRPRCVFWMCAGALAACGAGADDHPAVPDIDEAALRRHIEALASFGSRVPGYAGNGAAAAYLRGEFETLGYTDIQEDTFEVTVPVDEGSSLEILDAGSQFTLHALWPNLVRTSQLPPEGVTGVAIDGKQGHWADFNGHSIKDNIVFLEFNTDARWVNAAMLGARAVIFVEPNTTTLRQAENKLANVPLNVPRFWMKAEAYAAFAEAGFGQPVRIRCRMPWRRVTTTNLRVRLEGTDPALKEYLVCIQAYYDSMSVVPSLAPGAEMACGVATQLELARTIKENPPPGGVLFLAVSGHHLQHAGMHDFMNRHSRKRGKYRKQIARPINADLMLCLDLTSQNQTVGMVLMDKMNQGAIFRYESMYQRAMLRHAYRFRDYAEALGPMVGRAPEDIFLNLVLPESGSTWVSYVTEMIALDGTIALAGATPAVSLVTTRDPREAFDTPLDRPAGVNLANLAGQARFLAAAVHQGLRDETVLKPPAMNEDKLTRFTGRVVAFDPTQSFIPDQPVPGGIGLLAPSFGWDHPGPPTRLGMRTARLALADEDGYFTIPGVHEGGVSVVGYGIDPKSGDIVYALDHGLEGIQQFPAKFRFDQPEKERTAVVFPCRATDLYDIVDPRYLIPMSKLLFYDAGNVEPFAFGFAINRRAPALRTSEAAPYATVFSKPGVPLKIGVSADILGQRMLFLNAPSPDTQEQAEGQGYPVGETRLIENAPFQVLRDMHHLDTFRMRQLRKYGIENRRLERLHAEAQDAFVEASAALKEKQWDRFIKFSRRGLGIESRAYPDVTATANDVVKGIVFYMALMVPFAFFCERLFFSFSRLKNRIAAFSGIFLATYMVLRFVHPAFQIVATSEIILLALIILVLSGIVVFISSRQFEAQMRSRKRQAGRVHEADVSRASATGTAFSLGVSNMRRRKVRTLLTCTAIVLLMFTVLSFTSVTSYLRARQLPRPNTPSYDGALIRDRTWRPMPFLALDHIQSEFADTAVISRRSWVTPRQVGRSFTQLSILLRPVREDGIGAERIRCFGLLGLEANEPDVSRVDGLLIAGRWFEEGERDVCIIPDTLAGHLGIAGDEVGRVDIHLLGTRATVVGIVSTDGLNEFRDLDNEKLTPLDFSRMTKEAIDKQAVDEHDVSQLEGRAALQSQAHLDAGNVVLMPYERVLDLDGTLQSVALVFHDGRAGEHISRFLDRLAVTVFVGEDNKTKVYSSLAASSVGGMSNIVVPVLIAALMVLNTMSGSVHERLKEIGTYSSVGLAPSHIGSLFIAEACVYAILGGIAGYVLGQVVTKGLTLAGGLGGLTLNYSSLASVFATLVVMATVLLSTVYPARMASRLAVPDVTRRWKLPDPDGDTWSFDFPFTVSSKEVTGLYVFFRYYFASYEEQSVGRFYTSNAELSRFQEDGEEGYGLRMRVWLSPYDLGVSQDVDMRAVPSGDFGVYQIRLIITRLSGQASTWVRINRGFLNEIRKQFLIWRTVSPESKQEYTEEAEKAFPT